ncbi:MAG: hypothetical protein K1X89_08850 [Myxococcaceae bacterium]|nr:hypothetical protein [Myxococcaceae bacterium]
MSTARSRAALFAAIAFAAACGATQTSKLEPCDAVDAISAQASEKAKTCLTGDAGFRLNFASRAQCEAGQSKCTQSDKDALNAGVECAKKFAYCDSTDGGVLKWSLDFGFGCLFGVSLASDSCKAAFSVAKDGG